MGPKERKLIAIVIVGTLRNWRERRVNILEVAEALRSLYKLYGSLKRVSATVKLSQEMVRQFLKLLDLTDEVKHLIKQGHINSVDIGYRISKLKKTHQTALARAVVGKNLCSKDVRSVVRYKLDNPKMPINQIVKRVLESKDKKHFVAYLAIEQNTFRKLKRELKAKDSAEVGQLIPRLFGKVASRENIVHLTLNGRVILIKVTRNGLRQLRDKAKELSTPLSGLGESLVREFVNEKSKIGGDK